MTPLLERDRRTEIRRNGPVPWGRPPICILARFGCGKQVPFGYNRGQDRGARSPCDSGVSREKTSMTAQPAAAAAKATLITFPPSLDCELARFVLGHYAIPYEEVRHTVLFSSIYTLWH